MQSSTMYILAASDLDSIIKVLVALAVLAAGAIGSYMKNKAGSEETPVDEETPTKPRPVQPRYPTAQPMPDGTTPRPVIVQRQETPHRPVVTRPTAPPVVAQSPIPTSRKAPAPRPIPRPISRIDRPPVAQQPPAAKRPKRVEPSSQDSESRDSRRATSGDKRQRVRPTTRLESQTVSDALADIQPARTTKGALWLTSRESLRNAFIVSEILAPPLSLRPVDEPLW